MSNKSLFNLHIAFRYAPARPWRPIYLKLLAKVSHVPYLDIKEMIFANIYDEWSTSQILYFTICFFLSGYLGIVNLSLIELSSYGLWMSHLALNQELSSFYQILLRIDIPKSSSHSEHGGNPPVTERRAHLSGTVGRLSTQASQDQTSVLPPPQWSVLIRQGRLRWKSGLFPLAWGHTDVMFILHVWALKRPSGKL